MMATVVFSRDTADLPEPRTVLTAGAEFPQVAVPGARRRDPLNNVRLYLAIARALDRARGWGRDM
jgi:hypothetical protein